MNQIDTISFAHVGEGIDIERVDAELKALLLTAEGTIPGCQVIRSDRGVFIQTESGGSESPWHGTGRKGGNLYTGNLHCKCGRYFGESHRRT